ncbi:hypothetical protein CAPTEDRAFT_215884 [Capitella teleta]|uniref:Uncharacterized protein n=1 Tax=Capitella teleta TaxID=283909 RepID=R7TZW4_CAPTE|nr:hypothetical protein CAPTEDRAFT_215884 [Capitella teleta]|eukprot:ELT99162.1 hypothetical protein CAPTEDRAFT_215884 [Capitella teleta]
MAAKWAYPTHLGDYPTFTMKCRSSNFSPKCNQRGWGYDLVAMSQNMPPTYKRLMSTLYADMITDKYSVAHTTIEDLLLVATPLLHLFSDTAEDTRRYSGTTRATSVCNHSFAIIFLNLRRTILATGEVCDEPSMMDEHRFAETDLMVFVNPDFNGILFPVFGPISVKSVLHMQSRWLQPTVCNRPWKRAHRMLSFLSLCYHSKECRAVQSKCDSKL